MISISISQKQIVLDFFAEDIKIVKKYFNAIGFDFDERFKFNVFKEFENLKTELQMLITKAQTLTVKREIMEGQAKDTLSSIPPDEINNFIHELKRIRREQVDTIHFIGTHRQELETHQANLKAFEDLHREEFLRYFNEIKEKLTYQYAESLNYFGFEFNESLFRNSERSSTIQRFKKEAGIQGNINLCKYVEYYLRNVIPEALADAIHKEKLLCAKKYCNETKSGTPL
ncbi:MAG: hypothetical protein ACXW33_04850 [Sulfuricurvum sp.]